MTTEKIIADAEAVALYFRTLIANGIPPMCATQIASSYASALVISASHKEPPKEPWA